MSKELTVEGYLKIDGKERLWFTRNADGGFVWHIPGDEKIIERMVDSIGERMSSECL